MSENEWSGWRTDSVESADAGQSASRPALRWALGGEVVVGGVWAVGLTAA